MKKILLAWLVAGSALAQVTVQEYPVPRGHRVHDVWADATPGGPVWISAQGSGKIKVVDAPKGRGPYGIHATPDGTVYYASLAGSFIGKINPDGSTTVIEPPTACQGARRVWTEKFASYK